MSPTRIPRINQDLVNEVEDLQARVQYLVDSWPGGTSDGGITFPDGEFWPAKEKP